MSKTLSAVAAQEFDDEVKHAFQGKGMLRNTVTIRNNVIGDTYVFRKMGKGMANQKPSQADVTPMDVTNTKINCTLSNWNAPEYTDIFDQAEVNFDEMVELAEVIAGGLGRRIDQLIIDALDAEASPAADIASGATGLTLAKLTQTVKAFADKGVPGGNRHIAIPAAGLEDMLNDTTISSADYNTVKLLMNGEIHTFLGFTWHVIETRDEGGLPKAGSTWTALAWHRSAIGMAIGIDVNTEVNYIPQKTSWLSNGIFKGGAVSRDGDGIVKIDFDE